MGRYVNDVCTITAGHILTLLQVSDQRDVVFRVREYQDYFPGSGHSLGGRRGPSKLLPSSTQQLLYHGKEAVGNERETSELPGMCPTSS